MSIQKKSESGVPGLINDLTEQFLLAFRAGIQSFQDAGDALAKLVDADPRALDRLQAEHGVRLSVMRQFLAIGRRRLLPELFTAPDYVKSLPLRDQKLLVKGEVEAVVLKPDGTADHVRVDVMAPEKWLVRQVIGPQGIRTLAEQRALLLSKANACEAARAAAAARPSPLPYRVVGKKVVISGTEFTAADLLNLLKLIS